MSDITLDGRGLLSSTCIPNVFIDKYMINANGEFVKIYLYLVRCMDKNLKTCSLSELADVFEHTEKDILRALAYWEKMHLLHVEYDQNREVSGISLDFPDNVSHTAAPLLSSNSASPKEYSKEQMERFQKNENIQEVLFITEHYLGRTLNPTDISAILYWYDELHFSTDLIEYLVETCIGNGHTSFRYMEKIALSWAKEGICSVEDAKKERSMHNKDAYAVMKAFGISGRNLIASELSMVQKWTGSYAFSMELIKEACRRTILATGKPRFEYTDTILTNWYNQNVHTLEDIQKLDAQRQKERAASKSCETAKRARAENAFHNFPQRSYNYDQLEQQLLNTTR